MRKLVFVFFVWMGVLPVFAQAEMEEITGVVSYVTSQNVYVKFPSAKKINDGDPLFVKQNGSLVAALIVEHRSSVSCVGKPAGDMTFKIGDPIVARVPKDQKKDEAKIEQADSEKPIQDRGINKDESKKESGHQQKTRGRMMMSSYANISNLNTSDSYRLRYTFSLNADQIANSNLSFENYISFSHNNKNWAEIQSNIFEGLKIYSINLNYKIGENSKVSLGRKINPKISSIGAIDGFQAETGFKNFYAGGVVGYRPDYSDYGFNFNLLEYGGYLGHTLNSKKGRMLNSLGVFEQTNAGHIDRRFAYFQHDNTLINKLSFFFSSEMDLYRLKDGQPITDIVLTSLYASVRYRPFRKFSVLCSYDNRRNVIYYETFKSYVDLLLQDATRQGLQMRINLKPIKYMYFGMSSSYRVRDNDSRPTQNLNGFLTYSNVPWINASATLSANVLQNSYLNGNVYGLRLTRDFLNGKLNTGLNYRYVAYTFENNATNLVQNIGEADLSFRFSRKFSLSLNYEGTFENQTNYHRVYFSAIKRF